MKSDCYTGSEYCWGDDSVSKCLLPKHEFNPQHPQQSASVNLWRLPGACWPVHLTKSAGSVKEGGAWLRGNSITTSGLCMCAPTITATASALCCAGQASISISKVQVLLGPGHSRGTLFSDSCGNIHTIKSIAIRDTSSFLLTVPEKES